MSDKVPDNIVQLQHLDKILANEYKKKKRKKKKKDNNGGGRRLLKKRTE